MGDGAEMSGRCVDRCGDPGNSPAQPGNGPSTGREEERETPGEAATLHGVLMSNAGSSNQSMLYLHVNSFSGIVVVLSRAREFTEASACHPPGFMERALDIKARLDIGL